MEQAPPCLFWSLTSFVLQVRQIASLTEQVKNETARVRAEQKVEAFRNRGAAEGGHPRDGRQADGGKAQDRGAAEGARQGACVVYELQTVFFFPVEGKHAEEGAEGA